MTIKKTRRSAFDQLPPSAVPAEKPADNPVEIRPEGMVGLNAAGARKRPRTWEQEHQYGKGYSVKGVRPDINMWLLEISQDLGVRVAEVAAYALAYSMNLVDAGTLKIKICPNPRGTLYTLFPDGYDESGGAEARIAIGELAKKSKKKGKKTQTDDWKNKPVNWTPFDQELKERIVTYCRDRLPQGEFITFLLEQARADYERGDLKFNPSPRSAVVAQLNKSDR